MSSISTTPSPPPQAKARNTGLLLAVLWVLTIGAFALLVDTGWQTYQSFISYDKQMAQRNQAIGANRVLVWLESHLVVRVSPLESKPKDKEIRF